MGKLDASRFSYALARDQATADALLFIPLPSTLEMKSILAQLIRVKVTKWEMRVTIEIIFETRGRAPAGINIPELQNDVRAEVEELSARLSATRPTETAKSAPDGAQGEAQLIEWIIELIKEPSMIPAYLKIFAYSMNALLSPGQEKKDDKKTNPDQADLDLDSERPRAFIKYAGKTLALPAAVTVIKKFFEE